MKPGIHEGCTNRTEVAEWSGEERIYLMEHVERAKEGQDDISYILGESIAVVCSSSFSESLRKKGLEGLHVVDPAHEFALRQPIEFDGKKLESTTKGRSNLGDEGKKRKL